jgi:hypothetical protein
MIERATTGRRISSPRVRRVADPRQNRSERRARDKPGSSRVADGFQQLRLTLDLPSKRVAPISVPLSHISTGHYLATGFTIPLPGTWRVSAYPLVNQFDELTVTGKLKLGGS